LITTRQIEIVVQKIVEIYQPQQILLFGSYAHGTANEGSDLDFLLVKNTDEPPVKRAALIRKELRTFFLPMDILVFTPEEIARDKNRKFTFIYEVFKTGKSLYENRG
jgi:predicted nucleotidyltransferase